MDIKTIIRRHGETVYTVAEKMGIKQPSLSNIINGNPTVKKLEELARVIGCSPAEFFEDWNADGQAAAEDQPSLSVETEEQTATGVFVCPHCGAGVSFNTFVVVEPKKEGKKDEKELSEKL